ncbi:MAG: hypothetical protein LUI13_01885, partial [Lachnospiraceae bacterium]|nr:hypothetical protein [Lachnospiraceae bacterium]
CFFRTVVTAIIRHHYIQENKDSESSKEAGRRLVSSGKEKMKSVIIRDSRLQVSALVLSI